MQYIRKTELHEATARTIVGCGYGGSNSRAGPRKGASIQGPGHSSLCIPVENEISCSGGGIDEQNVESQYTAHGTQLQC